MVEKKAERCAAIYVKLTMPVAEIHNWMMRMRASARWR